jgi:S-adenosylmethionine decarboxylase
MKVKVRHGLGNHLVFDGHAEGELSNPDFIEEFILDLVEEIEMTAISDPLVLFYQADEESESGVTGTIILAESNITIHTYHSKKWFCLDVYSCKEFDIDKTTSFVVDRLNVIDYEKRLLRRGDYGDE